MSADKKVSLQIDLATGDISGLDKIGEHAEKVAGKIKAKMTEAADGAAGAFGKVGDVLGKIRQGLDGRFINDLNGLVTGLGTFAAAGGPMDNFLKTVLMLNQALPTLKGALGTVGSMSRILPQVGAVAGNLTGISGGAMGISAGSLAAAGTVAAIAGLAVAVLADHRVSDAIARATTSSAAMRDIFGTHGLHRSNQSLARATAAEDARLAPFRLDGFGRGDPTMDRLLEATAPMRSERDRMAMTVPEARIFAGEQAILAGGRVADRQHYRVGTDYLTALGQAYSNEGRIADARPAEARLHAMFSGPGVQYGSAETRAQFAGANAALTLGQQRLAASSGNVSRMEAARRYGAGEVGHGELGGEYERQRRRAQFYELNYGARAAERGGDDYANAQRMMERMRADAIRGLGFTRAPGERDMAEARTDRSDRERDVLRLTQEQVQANRALREAEIGRLQNYEQLVGQARAFVEQQQRAHQLETRQAGRQLIRASAGDRQRVLGIAEELQAANREGRNANLAEEDMEFAGRFGILQNGLNQNLDRRAAADPMIAQIMERAGQNQRGRELEAERARLQGNEQAIRQQVDVRIVDNAAQIAREVETRIAPAVEANLADIGRRVTTAVETVMRRIAMEMIETAMRAGRVPT